MNFGSDSISKKLLLWVGGVLTVLSAVLAVVTVYTFRNYFNDMMVDRAQSFAQRIVENHPDLWREYESNPSRFGERLREFVLSEPDTGLYLLDSTGRVRASAGDGRIFWSRLRVNIEPLRETLLNKRAAGIYGADPDFEDSGCLVSGAPVMMGTREMGWIYVVARAADRPLPERFGGFAIKAAGFLALTLLGAAALITVAVRQRVVKPLGALTRAAEHVQAADFCSEIVLPESVRPDEIGQLSRSFNTMLKRLGQESALVKAHSEQRREMVQSITHDIRTPLTALTTQLETIKLKTDLDPEQQQRYLDAALRNAGQLKRLMEALAELSMLDQTNAQAKLEPCDMGDLVSDTVQRMEPLARAQGIALTCEFAEGLPWVQVDPRLIERALTNLVDNAMRVTPPEGKIQIRLEAQKNHLILEVQDSGPGIAPAERGRVFERFYQGSDHRAQRGSAGLGLSIVMRVAELHRASISIVDKPNGLGGACFQLTLPLTT
jgi:signal transduction histidine kinase